MVEKFILFVSGIPEGTNPHGLISYFNLLGFRIRIFHKDSTTTKLGSQISSGHCLIKVDTEKTYEAILSYHRYYFMGRRLMVSPYLRGANLQRENSQKNKRRIVVKQVPSFVHESELVLCLEHKFGIIESIYKFKDSPFSSLFPSIKASSVNSFSVMLRYPYKGPAFTVLRIEIIPGKSIYVERFKFKLKNNKTAPISYIEQPQVMVCSKEYLNQPAQASLTHKLDISNQISQNSLRYALKSRGRSLHQEQKFKTQKESTRRSRSLDLKIESLKGYRRAEFIEELQSKSHHIKPSTKAYQWLRQEEPEYLATV